MFVARQLLLTIALHVVVTLGADVGSRVVCEYACQYIPTLYNKTTAYASSCVESQLSDDSRLKLIKAFNEFRSDTSRGLKDGTKHNNVFSMRYHWLCEYFAAYLIKHNMRRNDVSDDTKRYFLNDTFESLRAGPFGAAFGSLSSGDQNLTYVRPEDFFGVYDVDLDEKTQKDFIRTYVKQLSQTMDPYLTTHGEKVLWSGTTHFGCALRLNSTYSTRYGYMLCVFFTDRAGCHTFTNGPMSDRTCNEASPKGSFLSNVSLCIDVRSVTEGRVNDVPCQFFYDIDGGILRQAVRTCNGEDPGTNDIFLYPPDGWTHARVYFNGRNTYFGFIQEFAPTKSPNGTMKLYSLSISLKLLTAFVHKFYF